MRPDTHPCPASRRAPRSRRLVGPFRVEGSGFTFSAVEPRTGKDSDTSSVRLSCGSRFGDPTPAESWSLVVALSLVGCGGWVVTMCLLGAM